MQSNSIPMECVNYVSLLKNYVTLTLCIQGNFAA